MITAPIQTNTYTYFIHSREKQFFMKGNRIILIIFLIICNGHTLANDENIKQDIKKALANTNTNCADINNTIR